MFRSYSDHRQGYSLLKLLTLKFVKNVKVNVVIQQLNIWCVYVRCVWRCVPDCVRAGVKYFWIIFDSRGRIWIQYVKGANAGPQWPRAVRRRSAADRLLGLWVRIPPGAWMSVCCDCCVLSGRGLCFWSPIQRSPTECGASECDHESSVLRRWSTGGCCSIKKKQIQFYHTS